METQEFDMAENQNLSASNFLDAPCENQQVLFSDDKQMDQVAPTESELTEVMATQQMNMMNVLMASQQTSDQESLMNLNNFNHTSQDVYNLNASMLQGKIAQMNKNFDKMTLEESMMGTSCNVSGAALSKTPTSNPQFIKVTKLQGKMGIHTDQIDEEENRVTEPEERSTDSENQSGRENLIEINDQQEQVVANRKNELKLVTEGSKNALQLINEPQMTLKTSEKQQSNREQSNQNTISDRDTPLMIDTQGGFRNYDLFAWGLNDNHQLGQLGLHSTQEMGSKRSSALSPTTVTKNILIPRKVRDISFPIKNIACASNHSIILPVQDDESAKPQIYALGTNSFGQIGLSVHKYPVLSQIMKIGFEENFMINQVCTCDQHTVLLCQQDREQFLMVSGLNANGQLMVQTGPIVDKFTRVNVLEKLVGAQRIQKVMCGTSCTALVVSNNHVQEIYVAGKLGSNDKKQLRKMQVPFEVQGIQDVKCGEKAVILLSSSGIVYMSDQNEMFYNLQSLENIKEISAHKNDFASLDQHNRISTWQVDDAEPFKQLEQESNIQSQTQLSNITIGQDFGHAMDQYGNLYGWGNNKNGELGTGDSYPRTKLAQVRVFSSNQQYMRCKQVFNGQFFSFGLFEKNLPSIKESISVLSIGENNSSAHIPFSNKITFSAHGDRSMAPPEIKEEPLGLSMTHKFGESRTKENERLVENRLQPQLSSRDQRKAQYEATENALKQYREHSRSYKNNAIKLKETLQTGQIDLGNVRKDTYRSKSLYQKPSLGSLPLHSHTQQSSLKYTGHHEQSSELPQMQMRPSIVSQARSSSPYQRQTYPSIKTYQTSTIITEQQKMSQYSPDIVVTNIRKPPEYVDRNKELREKGASSINFRELGQTSSTHLNHEQLQGESTYKETRFSNKKTEEPIQYQMYQQSEEIIDFREERHRSGYTQKVPAQDLNVYENRDLNSRNMIHHNNQQLSFQEHDRRNVLSFDRLEQPLPQAIVYQQDFQPQHNLKTLQDHQKSDNAYSFSQLQYRFDEAKPELQQFHKIMPQQRQRSTEISRPSITNQSLEVKKSTGRGGKERVKQRDTIGRQKLNKINEHIQKSISTTSDVLQKSQNSRSLSQQRNYPLAGKQLVNNLNLQNMAIRDKHQYTPLEKDNNQVTSVSNTVNQSYAVDPYSGNNPYLNDNTFTHDMSMSQATLEQNFENGLNSNATFKPNTPTYGPNLVAINSTSSRMNLNTQQTNRESVHKLNKYKRKLKKYILQNGDLKRDVQMLSDHNNHLTKQNQRLFKHDSHNGEVQAKIDELEKELQHMQNHYENQTRAKEDKIAQLATSNDDLHAEIEDRDKQYTMLEDRIGEVEFEIQGLVRQLDKAHYDNAKLTQQLNLKEKKAAKSGRDERQIGKLEAKLEIKDEQLAEKDEELRNLAEENYQVTKDAQEMAKTIQEFKLQIASLQQSNKDLRTISDMSSANVAHGGGINMSGPVGQNSVNSIAFNDQLRQHESFQQQQQPHILTINELSGRASNNQKASEQTQMTPIQLNQCLAPSERVYFQQQLPTFQQPTQNFNSMNGESSLGDIKSGQCMTQALSLPNIPQQKSDQDQLNNNQQMFEIYSQAQDLTHDSHITAPTDDIRYQFGPNVNYDYTHRSANTCNNFVEQFNNQLNNNQIKPYQPKNEPLNLNQSCITEKQTLNLSDQKPSYSQNNMQQQYATQSDMQVQTDEFSISKPRSQSIPPMFIDDQSKQAPSTSFDNKRESNFMNPTSFPNYAYVQQMYLKAQNDLNNQQSSEFNQLSMTQMSANFSQPKMNMSPINNPNHKHTVSFKQAPTMAAIPFQQYQVSGLQSVPDVNTSMTKFSPINAKNFMPTGTSEMMSPPNDIHISKFMPQKHNIDSVSNNNSELNTIQIRSTHNLRKGTQELLSNNSRERFEYTKHSPVKTTHQKIENFVANDYKKQLKHEMKTNDIKFSNLSQNEQSAMIDLFRDRSNSLKDVSRSKSPIEEKIKRGQITGIASDAVRRALEIQNGPRQAFERAVTPTQKYVSPAPILRNEMMNNITQAKQKQDASRDISPIPREMKSEDKETIQLTNKNPSKSVSHEESLQKTQPRYDHKNAILNKFTKRTTDKINQRMKQRDAEDPVQSHLQALQQKQSDQKPPTQNTKPPKEVSQSSKRDDVSINSRKSYGNLRSSQEGLSQIQERRTKQKEEVTQFREKSKEWYQRRGRQNDEDLSATLVSKKYQDAFRNLSMELKRKMERGEFKKSQGSNSGLGKYDNSYKRSDRRAGGSSENELDKYLFPIEKTRKQNTSHSKFSQDDTLRNYNYGR